MIDITLPDSTLFRGLFVLIGAIIVFPGSVYLLLFTNLGKKVGFLVAGSALFGWLSINSILFMLYVPRGPRPAVIEGLNAFELRVIPGAMLIASVILFAMFVVSLTRLESTGQDG